MRRSESAFTAVESALRVRLRVPLLAEGRKIVAAPGGSRRDAHLGSALQHEQNEIRAL